jgi:hypothetical protein
VLDGQERLLLRQNIRDRRKTDLHHRIPDLDAVAGSKIPALGSKTSQQPLESLHPLEKSFRKNLAGSGFASTFRTAAGKTMAGKSGDKAAPAELPMAIMRQVYRECPEAPSVTERLGKILRLSAP